MSAENGARGKFNPNGAPRKFNPLDGFRYYPRANQPHLMSGCTDPDDPPGIPALLGFINEEGTVIQITWENAARHGIFVLKNPPETLTMEEYAQRQRMKNGNGSGNIK